MTTAGERRRVAKDAAGPGRSAPRIPTARRKGAAPAAAGKRKGSPAGDVHVALLRGINVAGKNRLPMPALAAMFVDAGCRDVRTYIQSGNVVFRADAARSARIAAVIERAIATRFGLDVPVMMRTAAELESVARHNPFSKHGADAKAWHVVFLLEAPGASSVASLDADRSPPDEFVVRGREIYLRCPHGVGRSKLTAQYFDGKLRTTSTFRNWNTVLKLVELSREG